MVNIKLGGIVDREIGSTIGPFHAAPCYKTRYPDVVIRALGELYDEYNRAFCSILAVNQEWRSDYRFGMFGDDGTPVNCAVQIDMLGLTNEFLGAAVEMTVDQVRESLRGMVFEIENSLAMYELLQLICAEDGADSFFKTRFRSALDDLRARFGKPIALLAVTDQKHMAMRESEFGKRDGETLTDDEVRARSGFDRLFGPTDFREYIEQNGGECGYLLYARTSDPVDVLKNPSLRVFHPLLGDEAMRRIIKAHTITFNVDNPASPRGHASRINDTKTYMPLMGMGFPIASEIDLLAEPFATYLQKGKPYGEYSGNRLANGFMVYLLSKGIDPDAVSTGSVPLRCKPILGTYGCYGHVSGALTDSRFRGEFRRNLRLRGGYIVQPEMALPTIVDQETGVAYTYIDRIFMSWTDGNPVFLGGFRSLMPIETMEAHKGRNHGNGRTVWAEITG